MSRSSSNRPPSRLGVLLAVFTNRRAALLFALGFASGLPFMLVGTTLTAWLTEAGIRLEAIGAFALVGLPYALKWAWAPILDRFRFPFLGRRRSWMLLTQVALMALIATMGALDPARQTWLFTFLAASVAFFSATQDVVTDGYRADLLGGGELVGGTTTFVLGYRLAILVSTAGALILAHLLSWPLTYAVMAALMAVGPIATLFAPEPALMTEPPKSLIEAAVDPLRAFFQRPAAIGTLGFVVLYKLADALLLTMPFFLSLGFSKAEIGGITKGFGALPSFLGIAAGGWLAARFGIRRSLWVAGIATASANLSFTALAIAGKSYPLLFLSIGIDNFCAGVVNAPWLAFLISLCDKRFSATQYALLSAAAGLGARLLGATSGVLAAQLGWARFFATTVVLAVPGLLVLATLPKTVTGPDAESGET